jgi:hypothetical protein
VDGKLTRGREQVRSAGLVPSTLRLLIPHGMAARLELKRVLAFVWKRGSRGLS